MAIGFLIAGACITGARGADAPDPLLDLLLKKGVITEKEADAVKTEAEAMRATNGAAAFPESKWKISKGIKSIELFGDLRLRFEDRGVHTPTGDTFDMQRGRYAVRLGLRGDALDNVYYGLRLDTAANPRSPWVTFGTSSSGAPYQGPFGKATAGINIGQVYMGWRPAEWLDLTAGKMPMPLYTTPMVWDTDYSPEGAAERFKYTVGQADVFATFGQFLYQDVNPSYESHNLAGGLTLSQDAVFQLAWEAGFNYHLTTNVSFKAAANVYNYIGTKTNTSPFFNGPFVGEGAYLGPGSAFTINGSSGYQNNTLTSFNSVGFPNNQVGLNHLLVVEVPFEVDFRIQKLYARLFGDVAYNLEGRQRAQDAAAAYASYLAVNNATIKAFAPQRNENSAYQIGFGVGNGGPVYGPMQGLVYGSTSKKNTWEVRTYWQHIEQYALDPNLLDSDFFEGRGNLEGIYIAAAYSFTDNLIGTARYGYARRINDKLGTGGSNQDIPQINPIREYHLLQLDLTFRF